LAVVAIPLFSFAPGEKTRKLSGNTNFLKEKVSIFVEFDYSKTSVDGLDSEVDYIEYKMKNEESQEEADKWKNAWENDKKSFVEYFGNTISGKTKKYPATFNIDNLEADYKLIVQPVHIGTGTPVKSSSFECKFIFINSKTKEEEAVIYCPKTSGSQAGPMSSSMAGRVNLAMLYTINNFSKYYKGLMKS
tara:strand:+ start:4599 stop:5168 length:570 start_codon:yes stop_codon:yes gene_type:complete